MPNWCSNTVTVTGPAADVEAFKTKMQIGDHPFDFNAVVKQPEIYDRTRSPRPDGPIEESAFMYDSVKDAEGMKKARPPTEEEIAELREHGHWTWYEWRHQNWGCKWNTNGKYVTVEDHTPRKAGHRGIRYKFDTAWCPPEALIARLRIDHGSLRIECRYSEPGMGCRGTC